MLENKSKSTKLVYTIRLDQEKIYQYEFPTTENLIHFKTRQNEQSEKWTELSHHQCPNCTLDRSKYPHCPIAFSLQDLLKDWYNIISYTPVELTVETRTRKIQANTTAQKALSSLLGLIMATSDCPHTQFFRPMAQFHLPLATSEETSFRAISTYLLTLYFKSQAGEAVDFDLSGLSKIYENMHELNVNVKKRLVDAVEHDAALNAVTVLDIFTITSTNYLYDELEKLKPLFSILLKNDIQT